MSADVHSFLGQSVPVELSVKGDRFVRRVVCYSSSPTAISFDDGGKLKIPAGESTARVIRHTHIAAMPVSREELTYMSIPTTSLTTCRHVLIQAMITAF